MRAAVEGVRFHNPAKVVVAVPAGSPEACAEFEQIADAVVCNQIPHPFYGVGMWYADFAQISDAEVRELLRQAKKTHSRR
jgi:predicted phosphoribosyltransferase